MDGTAADGTAVFLHKGGLYGGTAVQSTLVQKHRRTVRRCTVHRRIGVPPYSPVPVLLSVVLWLGTGACESWSVVWVQGYGSRGKALLHTVTGHYERPLNLMIKSTNRPFNDC